MQAVDFYVLHKNLKIRQNRTGNSWIILEELCKEWPHLHAVVLFEK